MMQILIHDRDRGQAHDLFRLGAQHGTSKSGTPLATHDDHARMDLFR